MTLYQFKKQRVTESHFFAQMSDGDVLEATNAPPTVTTGAFGSEVFDGATSPQPGSWSVTDDLMLFSNGVNQHQIYAGTSSYVSNFIVYQGAATIPDIPELGVDYTEQVTDGLTTTAAVLDSLDTYANFDCVFIRTPVPANTLGFTVSLPNGGTVTASVYYWNGAWTQVSGLSDGTASAGKTLAVTGSMSWTMPTDEKDKYIYGVNGFWYQLRVSAALDSEVEVSGVTFGAPWQSIRNIWDGIPLNAVEVQTEGTSTYSVFAGVSVTLSSLASGKKIMIASPHLIEGIYIYPGGTPNATGTTLTSLKYWSGTAFTTVGTVTDGTAGMSNAGWLTFPRAAAQKRQFGTSQFHAYWYELIWGAAIAASVVVEIYVMPYFDISELGKGFKNCTWKERALYSFDRSGPYIHVSQKESPFVLNGSDYGVLKAGDGRMNKIAAIRKFYNDLMVWQEESGIEGGTLTIYEGYEPSNYGKLLLSPKTGTFSDKSVEVIEGVRSSSRSNVVSATTAFFLSRSGVCASDGLSVTVVSGDIQNYFDPNETECIRYGYEKEMWVRYDSAFNVLRIGLVSGTSATVPNVFPVLDLSDMSWSFDTLGQNLSCVAEVEAGSGNTPIVQVGGGQADGTIYQLNYGTDDVTTAVDSSVILEIDGEGEYFDISEMLVQCKAQTGNITATITKNDKTTTSSTLTQTAEVTNQTIRRHRKPLNIIDQHLSVRLRHNTAGEGMFLYGVGFTADKWVGR